MRLSGWDSLTMAFLGKFAYIITDLLFCRRYFHQTKGTAMETPMVVNYANCFMGHSETNLLQDYKKKFRKEPTLA